jgi:hypothetical protein
VWQELSGVIEDVLENLTLADVIAPEKERSSKAARKEKERKPRAGGAGSKPCGKSSGGRRRKPGRK